MNGVAGRLDGRTTYHGHGVDPVALAKHASLVHDAAVDDGAPISRFILGGFDETVKRECPCQSRVCRLHFGVRGGRCRQPGQLLLKLPDLVPHGLDAVDGAVRDCRGICGSCRAVGQRDSRRRAQYGRAVRGTRQWRSGGGESRDGFCVPVIVELRRTQRRVVVIDTVRPPGSKAVVARQLTVTAYLAPPTQITRAGLTLSPRRPHCYCVVGNKTYTAGLRRRRVSPSGLTGIDEFPDICSAMRQAVKKKELGRVTRKGCKGEEFGCCV